VKKIVCCVMSLLMLFSMMPVSAAESFVKLDASFNGRVSEVIDGDAVLVRRANGQVALIKLIGVDTMGRMDAYEFLTEKALGADMLFVLDTNIAWDGRWNYAYAYKSNELINGAILQNGFGRLNPLHERATLHNSLLRSQNLARAARIGIWADPDYPGGVIVSGLHVNINTATANEIAAALPGITSSVASAIVTHRAKHPFQTVEDVKFVKGFTKAMFDRYRGNMMVSTNVLTATQEELAFLHGVSDSDAAKIVEYRLRNSLTNLRNLVTNGCITEKQYNDNLVFMALEDVTRIARTVPVYTVNINTASRMHLTNAGLTGAQADKVVALRGQYTFKSLYDVASALSLSEDAVNLLADNLHVWTEVNLATDFEFRTLFNGRSNSEALGKLLTGKQPFTRLGAVEALLTAEEYKLIAPYIYLNEWDGQYVNANTATVDQMVAMGISRAAATKLAAQTGKMTVPDKIPAEALGYTDRFTLYTDINTASFRELSSLHKDMSVALVNAVLDYRADQPFGSKAEIEQFFKDQKELEIYNKIKTFLVTR